MTINTDIAVFLTVLTAMCCHLVDGDKVAVQSDHNITYQMTQLSDSTEAPPADDSEIDDLYFHLQRTRFVIQKILVPIVVIVGVVLNCINIAVLTQKVMRTSSTNFYLTALACCDVLYLIFGLTMGLKHYESIKHTSTYARYRLPFGKPITDTCSNSGVWITLTFTIERYIGVCYPMKGKVICTPERAKIITLIVVLTAAIITVPEFFEWVTVETLDANNNTKVSVRPSALREADAYKWGYTYVNQALFTFLPLILLLVFNSLLVRAVMRATQQRRAMAKMPVSQNDRQERQQREQQRITIMLIGVVLVFLLCQMPQAIQNLYITYLQVSDNLTPTRLHILTITANVFNLLVMLNSSANFLLYSFFSMKFRRTFKRICCRCLLRASNMDHMFSEAEGSKTNLILQTTLPPTVGTSPRKSPNSRSGSFATPRLSTVGLNNKTSVVKQKNGYLEVQQGSFV
uniref:Orphan G-protein coupled receptor 15 n=2 Tax=Platynereis dumerilii TaxID=6359 RepID=A0A0K0PUF6_PLADU|nr:orphan G-protein coupled receptor 15 [Platynereis dumerilii]